MRGNRILEVEDLTVSLEGKQIISNISLWVGANDHIVAIIGPNGSGKTTLLNVITGLAVPKHGSIRFMGKEISGLPPHVIRKAGVFYCRSENFLFENLSVYENLELAAYTAEARRKFKENLEYIYNLFPILKERKRQRSGSLSGGERKMLGIAKAIMSNTKLLLLDEPSAGLAPLIVKEIFKSIKKLACEKSLKILVVEQRAKDALMLSERAYLIENGKIICEGKSENLIYNEYVQKGFLVV